jgi:lactate dehydrogenase-like 2-hydroxyacid dehydrogenase
MNKKIYITRNIPEVGLKILRDKGFDLEIYGEEHAPAHDELLENLKKAEYDGVITLLTDKVDSSFFDAVPTAKIVANYATGFNNIDVEESKKRGVVVTNTPGVSALAVAEHTVALMLALTTRLVEGDLFMREGKFKGWTPYNFVGTDLSGKTVGLVGVGNIGARVAHILNGFGVNIIYNDIAKNEKIESDCGAVFHPDVNELIKVADIVSLHVPLMDSTRHLINESHLKMMKPTAFLINTSRGPVVDEVALVSALQNKVIAGAGLDVFEFEPNLTEGLKDLDNVVLTPHIASARESARNDMAVLAAQSIVDFFDGNEVKNKVG